MDFSERKERNKTGGGLNQTPVPSQEIESVLQILPPKSLNPILTPYGDDAILQCIFIYFLSNILTKIKVLL